MFIIERIDTMLKYALLLKQLKKKDNYIITKLSIYYELSSLTNIEELLPEDINEIVEYVHNIYLNDVNSDYLYPQVAAMVLSNYNNDLNTLLHYIKKIKKQKTNLKTMSLGISSESVSTMTNYVTLLKELKEKDEYIITKLAIYHELTSSPNIKRMSLENIDTIVEYLHDIYLTNDDLNYLYPKVAEAALNVCNCKLSKLLSSIQENSDELEEQILYELNLI